MPQGAEPAQHGGDDGAHQGAVALGQRAEIALLQQLVERALLVQDAADDIGGDAPRGKAG